MRRYFMTIPEASQLVMQAGALSKDGEIFILDMGSPVKIVDLAHDLIRLSGFELGRDIDIEFTGIRPGEKLFEELNAEPDKLTKTKHASIFVVPEASDDIPRTLGESLISLSKGAEDLERSELYASMRDHPRVSVHEPAVASDVLTPATSCTSEVQA